MITQTSLNCFRKINRVSHSPVATPLSSMVDRASGLLMRLKYLGNPKKIILIFSGNGDQIFTFAKSMLIMIFEKILNKLKTFI